MFWPLALLGLIIGLSLKIEREGFHVFKRSPSPFVGPDLTEEEIQKVEHEFEKKIHSQIKSEDKIDEKTKASTKSETKEKTSDVTNALNAFANSITSSQRKDLEAILGFADKLRLVVVIQHRNDNTSEQKERIKGFLDKLSSKQIIQIQNILGNTEQVDMFNKVRSLAFT